MGFSYVETISDDNNMVKPKPRRPSYGKRKKPTVILEEQGRVLWDADIHRNGKFGDN